MGKSKGGRRSLVVVVAGIALVGVVGAGLWGLATVRRAGGLSGACLEVVENPRAGWVVTIGNDRCIVMVDPVPADTAAAANTLPPRLSNPDTLLAALKKDLPAPITDTIIGAVATAQFLVDETGVVSRHRMTVHSGYSPLDDAVLALAALAVFSPAEDGEGPTEAWVELTIGFQSPWNRRQQARIRLERLRRQLER